MGCESLFYTLFITLSVAAITYNIIISAHAPLKQGFPGPGGSTNHPLSPRIFSIDPVIKMPLDHARLVTPKKRFFHVAVTASDSVYNTWQCRIMYYWFNKFKDQPGSEMGGFTRILHSGKPDKFMNEIPTFVADPLSPGMDQADIGN
ncbi:Hydroxyproline O-arabinosyltransferase 1 [Asimina triloba]